jgi:branched-chain amino acid transport system substrate-binding protein
MYHSALAYAESEINEQGRLRGEKVQIRSYDDTGITPGAADRVRQALADGMCIFVQGGYSSVAAGISNDIRRWNERNPNDRAVVLLMGAEAADLTGKDCHFYAFRTTTIAAIRIRALTAAMTEAGVLDTRVATINQDYSWGREVEEAVEKNAEGNDYKDVRKILHKVGRIQDFSPYVERLRESQAGAVITGNSARDLLLLMQSVSSAGLKTRLGTTFLDNPGTLASAGKAAEGGYLAGLFNPEAGGEQAEAYRAAYSKVTGTMPVSTSNNGVIALRLLAAAIRAIPTDQKLDATKVALSLENATADWIHGPLRIRAADHQILIPVVVSVVSTSAKVKEDGTQMGFKPIAVLPPEQAIGPADAACRMQRPAVTRLDAGAGHEPSRRAAEWRGRWPAAVHGQLRPHARFWHDGRAELRRCLLHAGCLRRALSPASISASGGGCWRPRSSSVSPGWRSSAGCSPVSAALAIRMSCC